MIRFALTVVSLYLLWRMIRMFERMYGIDAPKFPKLPKRAATLLKFVPNSEKPETEPAQ